MDDLLTIQNLAADITIQDVLHENCEKALLDILDRLITQDLSSSRRLPFGFSLAPDIAKRLAVKGDIWDHLRAYCKRRLKDAPGAPAYLLEWLLRIYQPIEAGAWVAPSILSSLEPRLIFDKDHLLCGPRELLQFEKEGILTERHLILYDTFLPGTSRSGGFVEDLLETVTQASPRHFSVAVTTDTLLARDLYFSFFTKAYIRGPRGLSLERLQDPAFPQDASGTVTVHQRVSNSDDSLDKLLFQIFPLHRIEVMWSRRENLKSVQIEELVEVHNLGAAIPQGIANRYIHAQWNTEQQAFTHFDGAIRIYLLGNYNERLESDLKKFAGKAAAYQKLFRLDASLDLKTWSRLTTKFFDQNELVLEYLGGPENEEP